MPKDPFDLLNENVNVSHETFDRLRLYHDLLLKWQPKINLVGPDTISDSWSRHFLDSAQLKNHLPKTSKPIIDMGSGAGFPGMVLAILGVDNIHLIESDTKKISFLKEVARITKTNVTILHARLEDRPLTEAGCVLARACADLVTLLHYAANFVSHETTCLFQKGKNYSTELEEVNKFWSFDYEIIPSVTDTQGIILKLSHLKKRD